LAKDSLLILLLFPFHESFQSFWALLPALPYLYVLGRDLVQLGYRWSDLLRVYALNLLLIPVNLGGVFGSMKQAITGKKTPFARTPKVVDRTSAPGIYILIEFALVLACVLGTLNNALDGRWAHAAFALLNSLFLAYSITAFMGLRESWEDPRLALRRPAVGRALAPRRAGAVGPLEHG
jgi:hypothetical protein